MSKSLKRVSEHAKHLGLDIEIQEMNVSTNTAQQAADALGCELNQIAKSIIFLGETCREPILFLTAGGNRVDSNKASKCAKQSLAKADASLIRTKTGFAIGGVAPIGHLHPIECFIDPTLLSYETVWAAAGTPRHLFEVAPDHLRVATNGTIGDFCE